MSAVGAALERIVGGINLSREQAEGALNEILGGEVDPIQIAGFLVALRTKGETADEIAGMAAAVRREIGRAHV